MTPTLVAKRYLAQYRNATIIVSKAATEVAKAASEEVRFRDIIVVILGQIITVLLPLLFLLEHSIKVNNFVMVAPPSLRLHLTHSNEVLL